jgi:hypothetical protein
MKDIIAKYGTLGGGAIVIALFILLYFGVIDMDFVVGLLGG